MTSKPKGTFDILPKVSNEKDYWKNSAKWQHVESTIRRVVKNYGFQEIRTPSFERTEVFSRGIGETSDIVSKEMYTFLDKAQRSMTLRPEGTASVMRAFLENKLYNSSILNKFYYIAPMFRYERQQAGRYRQHHQFGVEAIGNPSPEQDAEIIDLAYSFCTELGLKGLNIIINSIGDAECRNKYKSALKDYLKPHFEELSEDSKLRFDKNPLRILDSKTESDIKIVENAPSILEFLSADCNAHFDDVCSLLKSINVPFKITPNLVRGLDYYNRTVFEITAEELGAQNSIAAGGRYDGLTKILGGPDLPSTGFAAGLERLIITMIEQKCHFPPEDEPTVFLIPLGTEQKEESFKLLQNLRKANISADMDFFYKKLKNTMRYANDINAKYVIIIGEEEVSSQKIKVKEMSSGNSEEVTLSEIVNFFKNKN